MNTDDLDEATRLHVYHRLVESGRAPTLSETASALNVDVEQATGSFRRLADQHIFVLRSDAIEIRMAMPFSAVPTGFEVSVEDRRWWGNCAWDALGIPAALGSRGVIESVCGDCSDRLTVDVSSKGVRPRGYVVHFAVPAARWWDDIGFT
jgi:hypothetical protein